MFIVQSLNRTFTVYSEREKHWIFWQLLLAAIQMIPMTLEHFRPPDNIIHDHLLLWTGNIYRISHYCADPNCTLLLALAFSFHIVHSSMVSATMVAALRGQHSTARLLLARLSSVKRVKFSPKCWDTSLSSYMAHRFQHPLNNVHLHNEEQRAVLPHKRRTMVLYTKRICLLITSFQQRRRKCFIMNT